MKTNEQIREFLEELNDGDILQIWNGIASYDGSVDELYDMYLLDEFFGDMKVSEFLDKLDSDFSHHDDYFYDSIWGICSTSDIYDIVDLGELADIIEDRWDDYSSYIDFTELDDFLEEDDEDDEEDFEEEAE